MNLNIFESERFAIERISLQEWTVLLCQEKVSSMQAGMEETLTVEKVSLLPIFIPILLIEPYNKDSILSLGAKIKLLYLNWSELFVTSF